MMGIEEIITIALAAKNLFVSISEQVASSDSLTDMEKEEFKVRVLADKEIPKEWI